MDNINQKILRPIGIIIVSVVGLLGVLFYFNKIFIGVLFALLLIDAISDLMKKS